MHSYQGKKYNFFHNGDFSGDIRILNKETKEETVVDGEDFMRFCKYALADLIDEFVQGILDRFR